MKKFIVLSLAGILIFALGATVYAQAPKLEFRVSGFIDAQTYFQNNVPPYNAGAGLLRVTPPTAAFGRLLRVLYLLVIERGFESDAGLLGFAGRPSNWIWSWDRI